ncbi:hypothetical protein I317_00076 [Kwoniella heveanensis CBS 569]|nr:hypothetical protein I317_00076 [Kwoniella heveanensis CBS 569]
MPPQTSSHPYAELPPRPTTSADYEDQPYNPWAAQQSGGPIEGVDGRSRLAATNVDNVSFPQARPYGSEYVSDANIQKQQQQQQQYQGHPHFQSSQTQSHESYTQPQPAYVNSYNQGQPAPPAKSNNINGSVPVGSSASLPARSRTHHSIMDETEEELTEDEKIEYEKGLITWEKAKSVKFWFRKEWTLWYILFVLIVVVVALMAFFHHSIINWLSPFVKKLREIKAGFVIPVAILFVLSFPPLFGNEIVMVLVGLVWGLGKGFAIVAVGVFLGETALFFVFKYWCRHRAERMTRKSLNYACLSEAVREGGFLMAWVVRLSVMPT